MAGQPGQEIDKTLQGVPRYFHSRKQNETGTWPVSLLAPRGCSFHQASDQIQPADHRIHDLNNYLFSCSINVTNGDLLQEKGRD